MSSEDCERFNFLQYCRVSEEVANLLTSLFHRCYSSKFGEWSENSGESFLNQDKYKYTDKQRQLIKDGQAKNWDISLLCEILLHSSCNFLIKHKVSMKVQCGSKECKKEDCKDQRHVSKTLKSLSPIVDLKKETKEYVLIPESKKSRPTKYAVNNTVNATEIILETSLPPKEYTVYLCSDEWVAVQQLREFRNEDLGHLRKFKYSKKDLQEKVEKIKAVYKHLGGATTQIDAMMSDSVETCKGSWLTEWQTHTAKIQDELDEIKRDVSELKAADQERENQFRGVEKKLEEHGKKLEEHDSKLELLETQIQRKDMNSRTSLFGNGWKGQQKFKPSEEGRRKERSTHQTGTCPRFGESRHNNGCAKAFDFHFDDLAAVFCRDEGSLLTSFADLVTSTIIRTPIAKKKASNPCLVIGCKSLLNDVWSLIDRASYSKRALARVLSILNQIAELRDIGNKIETKAKEFGANDLPKITEKKHDEDDQQVKSSGVKQAQSLVLGDQISKFADVLKSNYQHPPVHKWSPARDRGVSNFVDVVLENKSLHEKSSVNLDELFNLPYCSRVLIEGIPGIGKSTLAYEMCKRWANGIALQDYLLVILLCLREVKVQQYWSQFDLKNLISESYLTEESWKKDAIQEIIDSHGKGLLIILEGYDELPEEKQNDLEVVKEIKRYFSAASIIITARSSTASLFDDCIQFSKHIEIQGFKKSGQNRYIEDFLTNPKSIQSFKQYTDRYSVISKCLHVPLILVMVLEIFHSHQSRDVNDLPETVTELYQSLIKMLIFQELKSTSQPGTRIHLENLPPSHSEAFKYLCKSAYNMCTKKSVLHITEKIETFGLMRCESKVLNDGDTYVYSFFHPTIQEFLAAFYVYQQDDQDEVKLHFNKFCKISIMMRFLSGLTKSIPFVPDKMSSINIFHQLMEIKDDTRISQIFGKRKAITVEHVFPPYFTEQDFYVLGRCIALSSCTWKFGFTLRSLTGKHIDMLLEGFESVKNKGCPRLEEVVFTLNPRLGNSAIIGLVCLPPSLLRSISKLCFRATSTNKDCLEHCLSKFIHFDSLEIFMFHDNDFKKGEQKRLIDALCTLKNLKKVSFSNLDCDECRSILRSTSICEVVLYELSLSSIEAFFTALSPCKKLKCIEIYQSQITQEVVESSLTQSQNLFQSLKLINCAINSGTACAIIDAVSRGPVLEILDLSDNIIDDTGGRHIAEQIRARPFSKEIYLHHNNFVESTIHYLIHQLAQSRSDVIIYLSLQWKEVIPAGNRHIRFERPDTYTW